MDLLDRSDRLGTAEPPGRLAQAAERLVASAALSSPSRPAGAAELVRGQVSLRAELGRGTTAPLADRIEHLLRAGQRAIPVDAAGVSRLPLPVLQLLVASDRRLRARVVASSC